MFLMLSLRLFNTVLTVAFLFSFVQVIKFSPNGNLLAVGSRDNNIYVYQVTDEARKYSRIGRCSVSYTRDADCIARTQRCFRETRDCVYLHRVDLFTILILSPLDQLCPLPVTRWSRLRRNTVRLPLTIRCRYVTFRLTFAKGVLSFIK